MLLSVTESHMVSLPRQLLETSGDFARERAQFESRRGHHLQRPSPTGAPPLEPQLRFVKGSAPTEQSPDLVEKHRWLALPGSSVGVMELMEGLTYQCTVQNLSFKSRDSYGRPWRKSSSSGTLHLGNCSCCVLMCLVIPDESTCNARNAAPVSHFVVVIG